MSSPAGCDSSTASSSKSSFGAELAARRSASIARLRTIPSVHVRTLPRAASKRAPLRQTERKASWVTSSAIDRSPTILWASENAAPPWRS